MLSAADPLNLVGIVTDHPRVPSTAANRVAYLDGTPAAALKSGEVTWLTDVPEEVGDAILAAFGHSASARATSVR
jgi:ATP-dependent helicase Lhr and Lhr-like helicase